MNTTTRLEDFGHRELEMAGKLLLAVKDLPKEFEDNGIEIMFNANSGNVFLTNSDYQVAMFNGDTLEMWYSCPQCGHEGFLEDMEHEGDEVCQDYMDDIGLTMKTINSYKK